MKCGILKTDSSKVITREGNKIEFKESFNFSNMGKYSRTIAAFANNKGGCIIFGIKDTPRKLVGLQGNSFEQTDEEKITEFLNSRFSPEISFQKYVCTINEYDLGFLEVEKSENEPVVCIKQDNDGKLKESDIYYRYNSRTEKIKYPELNALFDRIKQKEENKWRNLLKGIAKISTENIVISGESKNSTNIHITDDPNARLVKIDDNVLLDNYPMDYKALILKLQERYTDLIQNKRFHEIKECLARNNNLCSIRYLDPSNKKGSNKKYYSKNILKKFDEHYTKR